MMGHTRRWRSRLRQCGHMAPGRGGVAGGRERPHPRHTLQNLGRASANTSKAYEPSTCSAEWCTLCGVSDPSRIVLSESAVRREASLRRTTQPRAELTRRKARARTVGRSMLASGLASIAGGVALLLWASGALPAVGIALMVLGAVVSARGNRRLAQLDRKYPEHAGDAASAVAAAGWFTGGGSGCGFDGHGGGGLPGC